MMFYHSIPGVLLIITGVSSLLSGHTEHLRIDVLGIVIGAALLVVLKRELKSKHGSHSKVAWFEVLAGIVIVLEGFHKLHHDKSWFQPGTLMMAAGVAVFLLGLFHAKLPAFRKLTYTETGFKVRTRPIRSFSGRWKDIKSFALDGNKLVIEQKNGSTKKHTLRSIENRLDVLKILNEELALHLDQDKSP